MTGITSISKSVKEKKNTFLYCWWGVTETTLSVAPQNSHLADSYSPNSLHRNYTCMPTAALSLSSSNWKQPQAQQLMNQYNVA